MLDWLMSWINDLIDWFAKWAEWIPKKFYSALMEALASFINAIPVPAFFNEASGAFSSIPSSVMWFASSLELGYGVTVVLSAYVLRLVLRRIPFVG